MNHAGDIFEGTEKDIREFMDSKGYTLVDTIKIDDIDFDETNKGVWCISKDKLINNANFTGWKAYKDDTIIKPEETK